MIGYMILGLLIAFGSAGISMVISRLYFHPQPKLVWDVKIERDGFVYDIEVSRGKVGTSTVREKIEIETGMALTYRAAVRRAARLAYKVETRKVYSFNA